MNPQLKLLLSIVPWTTGFPLEFVASDFLGLPYWTVVLIFAPVGEEAVKLLLVSYALVYSAILARRRRPLPSTPDPKRVALRRTYLVLAPFIVGLVFGAFEHFYTYGAEVYAYFAFRLLDHAGFVSADFLVCLLLWKRTAAISRVVTVGILVGALLHFINNYLSAGSGLPLVEGVIVFFAIGAVPLVSLVIMACGGKDRLGSEMTRVLFAID